MKVPFEKIFNPEVLGLGHHLTGIREHHVSLSQ